MSASGKVSGLVSSRTGIQEWDLTSSCGRKIGHPKDRVAGRHELKGGIRVPVSSMGLARHPFHRRGIHLLDAILVYFAHFRVLALHGEKRVTVEGVFLGCTTQIVEPLADLLL